MHHFWSIFAIWDHVLISKNTSSVYIYYIESSVLKVISNYGGLHLTVTYNVMTRWRADQVHDTRGEIMGHAVMQSP